ncbi:MAG TPA: PDZ domain-containing protein [Gemmatimonadaceae bacterium]|nr:PDZ domain-containing protein [Gemmatimonadaceae bacterium]
MALFPALPADGQDTARSAPISSVHYDVTFNRATAQTRSARVAMSFDVADTVPVLLSLPMWTPGAYRVTYFARNVQDFEAIQAGAALRWDKLDHDTWRVHPSGEGRVVARFRYVADSLDNAMAWSRADFLMFNGTNFFMYPEGLGFHWPATVEIHTEPDWQIGTAMPAGGPPGTRRYSEQNYHDLVDHPFFVGRIEMDSAQVAGRWMRLVTYPVGSVSGARRHRIWGALRAMTPPQVEIFGEVPWPSYNVMQIADSGYGGASGLEHKDSHVNVVVWHALDHPVLLSLYAHEIVHAWMVKRMRPADLFPYRYDGEQPSPLLWVSEGITDYYADVVLLRGGLIDERGFVSGTQEKIRNVEALPAISMEDASASTWMAPRDGTHYSYYDHGSVAGLLLDVMIRDATANARSLDDVVRQLYDSTWKQGRGFTNDEWWSTLERVSGRSFAEFRARYVDGRERLPYATVLPLAGIAVRADTATQPLLGVRTEVDRTGIRVLEAEPGGAAAAAGVQTGDYLLSVGDVRVTGADFGLRFRQRYGRATAGTPLALTVRREGRELSLAATLNVATAVTYSLSLDSDPDPRARAVREGIFRGVTAGQR